MMRKLLLCINVFMRKFSFLLLSFIALLLVASACGDENAHAVADEYYWEGDYSANELSVTCNGEVKTGVTGIASVEKGKLSVRLKNFLATDMLNLITDLPGEDNSFSGECVIEGVEMDFQGVFEAGYDKKKCVISLVNREVSGL